MEADILAADRGESPSIMEPLLVSEGNPARGPLADLALELTAASTGLRRSLPEGVVSALAALVRSMNCYYSNLIEGHDTHPIDIERALNNDYSRDPKKRDLQLEARAHIEVQQWIDEGGLAGRATTEAGLFEIHRRFCAALPEDLLWVENLETGERVRIVPGALRRRDVKVGLHVAVSPGALPRFMRRFEEGYARLGKVDTVIAAAAAHHRFLWLHPFLDGNGRVARLMSYALLRETLDTGGLWSIARGLARNEPTYKAHLAACDLPRRNDLDGRGALSEEALAAFAAFFLQTSIDQVQFMAGLMQPERLRDRMLLWAEEEVRADALPPRSGQVLEAVLFRGALPRSEVGAVLGATDRQARRVTSALLERGVLVAANTRAPLRLAFPATLAARWMPGLFP
ncbi:MAG: Fic family protein, partial [Parvularculaceae bacterium]|nr:Fic family protein [Parvularculaceae bacterium]